LSESCKFSIDIPIASRSLSMVKLASELWLVLPWAIVGFRVNALVLILHS